MRDARRSGQAVPVADHVIISEKLPARELDQFERAVHLGLAQGLLAGLAGLGVRLDGTFGPEIGHR